MDEHGGIKNHPTALAEAFENGQTVMRETETLVCNDIVPEDSQRIAGLNLDNDSVIVVREKDGQ